jgi:non-ribosomal peptide synthetase component F
VEDPQWLASRIAFDLDDALVERGRALAMECHATLPMLLHAALNAALHRLTGALDQPIGVLASTRESTGDAARDALGLFINAVVVRTRMSKADTPATLLATVRDAALAAYAHADAPFADVVSALNAERPGAANPLFQVMFNYLRPAAMASRDWAGLAIEGFDDMRHRVVFDLELDVTEHPDGRVSCAFSYANERVDAAFVEMLAQRYLATVEQFAHAPQEVFDACEATLESVARITPQPSNEESKENDETGEAQTLATIWSELFDGQILTPHDDLFTAGATSFAVVRFVEAARKAGFDIAIRDVFATPHFAGLASTLARRFSLASTNDI